MMTGVVGTAGGRSRPGWLLDEVGSAGRENLDADHVRRYDAKEDAGAGTFSWLLEPMLQRAGFATEEATYTPDGIFATYVARAT